MILSCYSESGFDLWFAAKANMQQVKAIIAVEPQNLNTIQNDYRKKNAAGQYNTGEPDPPVGKDVIPLLLKNGAKVFLIGRHHAQYRPAVWRRPRADAPHASEPGGPLRVPPRPDQERLHQVPGATGRGSDARSPT